MVFIDEEYRNRLSCLKIIHLGGSRVMYTNSIGTHEIFDIYTGHLYNIDVPNFRRVFYVLDKRRLVGSMSHQC